MLNKWIQMLRWEQSSQIIKESSEELKNAYAQVIIPDQFYSHFWGQSSDINTALNSHQVIPIQRTIALVQFPILQMETLRPREREG